MFDKTWVKNLPKNPILALKELSERFIEWDKSKTNEERLNSYQSYLDFTAFLEYYSNSHQLKLTIPYLSEDWQSNINRIIEYCYLLVKVVEKNLSKVMFENSRLRFGNPSQNFNLSELVEGDRSKVQRMINDLRKVLVDSSFEESHKRRMLKKLEKLQSELHTNTSLMEWISEIF